METFFDLTKFILSAAVSTFIGKRVLSCTWELTHRCTGKCKICNYWKNPSTSDEELELGHIQIGLEKIYSYGCRWVNFTGGEPTLRADLEEIVQYASKLGMWTTMVTNGSLLTRERIQMFKKVGLGSMFISLDSTNPQAHDKQRGISGSFAQVLKSLRWLHEEFLSSYRIGGIMCVLTRENMPTYAEILKLADDLGVYVVFQPYHANKTGNKSDIAELSKKRVDGILEASREFNNLLCTKTYIKGFTVYNKQGPLPPCHAGLKYFSIDPLGFLHPCVDMPRAGHLLKDDMSVIRSEEALRNVRSCPGCWYNFRGEGDATLSLKGYFEKLRLGLMILKKNKSFQNRLN
jgi:MoaA/NifB/PqqE/SkfB family radical SAM enzyme